MLSRRHFAHAMFAMACAASDRARAQTASHPAFPLAALYRRDTRRLAFVTARHTADPQSATHQIINDLFDRRSFAAAAGQGAIVGHSGLGGRSSRGAS